MQEAVDKYRVPVHCAQTMNVETLHKVTSTDTAHYCTGFLKSCGSETTGQTSQVIEVLKSSMYGY